MQIVQFVIDISLVYYGSKSIDFLYLCYAQRT